MDDDTAAQRMEAYLAARADRPFGDTEMVSGTTLAPFSRGTLTAADNLLAKADRALAAGDQERARRFVERACALPFDAHERTFPAAHGVAMLLFTAVADRLEDSPEGDERWLVAALEAMSSDDGWGRAEMRRTLLALQQDYDVTRGERRAIIRATSAVPERAELAETTMAPAELAAAVMCVLQVLRDYRAALDETG